MDRTRFRDYYREYYDRANDALSKNNPDYAVDLLQTCLKREPAFAAARELLHEAMRQQAKGKPPISSLKKVAIRTNLGVLASLKNRTTDQNVYENMAKVEKIIAQDPFSARALELLAKIAHRANLIETTIRTYQEIFTVDPTYLAAYKALSEIYHDRMELRNARKILDEASRQFPDDADVRKALKNLDALGTIEQKKLERETRDGSASSDEKPSAQEPEAPSAPDATIEDRIKDLQQLLKRNPSDLFLCDQLGELLYQQGDIDGAITYLQQAVQMT